MSSDPRLLRALVMLADELHFGRAAQRLHVTQPALSQQIQRLESQLGVSLFSRTRVSVELTEAGRVVLEPARAAVLGAESVDALARAFARGETRELRLGFTPGVHYLAQNILAELARRHPVMRVRARQENTGMVASLLAAGEIDVGLGFATRRAAGVRCERLADEAAVVAIDSGHALAGTQTVALADLREETFALVDAAEGRGYNNAVIEHCRRAGFKPRTVSDPHGPMAWETAVRTDGCVGLTTRSAAPSTARGIRLLELVPSVSFPLHLMLPSGSGEPMGAPVREFVRIAREGALERPVEPGAA